MNNVRSLKIKIPNSTGTGFGHDIVSPKPNSNKTRKTNNKPPGTRSLFSRAKSIFQTQAQKDKKLFRHIIEKNIYKVREYLERGANIESSFSVGARPKFFYSPLTLACEFSTFEIVKLLLDKGADINKNIISVSGEMNGIKPIHMVCSNKSTDNIKIAELLLENGAKADSYATFIQYEHLSPLDILALNVSNIPNRQALIRLFKNNGAKYMYSEFSQNTSPKKTT